jgi:site-specific DNA-adenine methylase
MTSYHGGKQRIGKEIAQVIRDTVCKVEAQTGVAFKRYLEPFCGMLGVYQHIPKLFQNYRYPLKYKAGDINESVIKMWKALQRGWEPPTKCSQKRFYELKGNGKSSAEKGFVGHACAFRGVYFGSFSDEITPQRLEYSKEKIINISENLKNKVEFIPKDYSHWTRLKGYIIYCDPPYITQSIYPDEYHTFRKFDHTYFYKWAEKMAKHNLVFVSERYKLPYTLVEQFANNEKLYLIEQFN